MKKILLFFLLSILGTTRRTKEAWALLFSVLLLCGCGLLGTDIGAPDYGAREVPKQPPGMSDDEYWKMLTREGWF